MTKSGNDVTAVVPAHFVAAIPLLTVVALVSFTLSLEIDLAALET